MLTASAVKRGTKRVDLKHIVDDACNIAQRNSFSEMQRVLVVEKSALPVSMTQWQHVSISSYPPWKTAACCVKEPLNHSLKHVGGACSLAGYGSSITEQVQHMAGT